LLPSDLQQCHERRIGSRRSRACASLKTVAGAGGATRSGLVRRSNRLAARHGDRSCLLCRGLEQTEAHA
jgi:hypothetical protein